MQSIQGPTRRGRFERVRNLGLATVLIFSGVLFGGTAHALTPVATLLPGQTWSYKITSKAYVNSECYSYSIESSPDNSQTGQVEFTGIGNAQLVSITPQQNQGEPTFNSCVNTVQGGSFQNFNVANLSATGGPTVLVYGDTLNQASYLATSLGATDCFNASYAPQPIYTVTQAKTFVNDYENGTPDTIPIQVECSIPSNGFVTDFSLSIESAQVIQDSQYTIVDGIPIHYYPYQTTCDLTRIGPASAAISCAPVTSQGMPAEEFNLFY